MYLVGFFSEDFGGRARPPAPDSLGLWPHQKLERVPPYRRLYKLAPSFACELYIIPPLVCVSSGTVRAALGTDAPVMFCNDEMVAAKLHNLSRGVLDQVTPSPPLGTIYSSGKMISIVGDRWWRQVAKQLGDPPLNAT